MTVGSKENLSYVKYSSDAQTEIYHNSKDPLIATVDENGMITAHQVGTAIIETTVKKRNTKDEIPIVVTDVPVSAAAVQAMDNIIQLNRNSEYQLTYKITPFNATNTKLYYTSSNPDIVKVNTNGVITAVRNGTAKIYASVSELNQQHVNNFIYNPNQYNYDIMKKNPLIAETVVNVINFDEIIHVGNIKASVENSKLFIGDTTKIVYEIIPSNATNQNVVYKSSDSTIAKVNANGEITTLKEGKVKIDVISNENLKKTSVSVTVMKKEKNESGKFTSEKISMQVDSKVALSFETNVENPKFISENSSIAVVNESNEIIAKKEGVTDIKLIGSKNQTVAKMKVQVTNKTVPLDSIGVSKNELILQKGASKNLELILKPSNATIQSISYTSSNPAIIAVTNNGKVTAKKGGQANITISVMSGGIRKSINILVKCDVKITKLTANYGKIDMMVGESKIFNVRVEPSDASNKRLRFKINNPKIVSIDEHGKVTGKQPGSTTIIITPRDGSNKFITIPITVRKKQNIDSDSVDDNYHNVSENHPRISVTRNDFERLRQTNNQYLNTGKQVIIQNANQYLEEGVVKEGYSNGARQAYKNNKKIDVRNYYLSYFETLGLAYQMTGDSKYQQAGKEELLALSRFQDWNFADYLYDAGMISGVSTGFDWLYDILSNQERKLIASAIYYYGINKDFGNYDKNTTNWNTVIFSSVGIGALSIYNEPVYKNENFKSNINSTKICDKECGDLIVKAVHALQSSFAHNGSVVDVLSYRGESNRVQLIDGIGYNGYDSEGMGYWSYAMNYMSRFISSLNNTLSNDYGFADKEAIRNTATYPIYMTGIGIFNYADAMVGIPNCNEAVLWLANQYDDHNLYWYYHTYLKNRYTPLSILWYQPLKAMNETLTLPLDKFYLREDEDVAILRGQNNITDSTTNQTYLALKGGYNYTNHGDLDIGNFVFDAMGVRWIYDIGRGNYNSKNYFNRDKNAKPNRYMYYPKRAEANNTLVLNPNQNDASPDQNPRSVGKIVDYKTAVSSAYAVVDMTDAYKNMSSGRRAAFLYDNRSKAAIIDEIKMKQDTTIYWQANVPNNVKIWYAPNSKITLAYPNGVNSKGKPIYKTVDVSLACSGSDTCKQLKFEVVPQISFINQLQNEPYNYITSGYSGNKLRIKLILKANEKLNLTVNFIPNYSGSNQNINDKIINIDMLKNIVK